MAISTKNLTWDKATRTFTGEASDFGPSFSWIQAWPDSADPGLDVVSHKTGTTLRCYVKHEELREGETLWWDLEPIEPRDRSFTVRIFND